MRDKGTPIFWLVSNSTRLKLMDFQWQNFKTKLDIANQKPPWEEVPPVPEIPVNEDSEELERIMQLPPMPKGRGY